MDNLATEIKKIVTKQTIAMLMFLTLGMLFVLDEGVSKYKKILVSRVHFKETERLRIQQYDTITQYGTVGFRVKALPSPLTALCFNNTVYRNLTANVDVTENHRVYSPRKGDGVIKSRNGVISDYSDIMLFIGAISALLFGFFIFRRKSYLRFRVGLHGIMKGFLRLFFWGLLVLNIAALFLEVIGIIYLTLMLPGFNEEISAFLIFSAIAHLVFLFFFVGGCMCAALRGKTLPAVSLLTFFFVLFFILPIGVEKVTTNIARNLPSVELMELDGAKKMMGFEKRIREKAGPSQTELGKPATQNAREILKGFVEDEYKSFGDNEEKILETLREIVKVRNFLSNLFPIGFYRLSCEELSGNGYSNYFNFSKETHQLKGAFFDFYLHKKFVEMVRPGNVPLFGNTDTHIFKSSGFLPFGFTLGLGATLFYTLLLFFFAYRLHLRRFRPGPAMALEIDFPQGENGRFVLCKNAGIKRRILQHFRRQPGTVCLEKIKPADFRLGLKPVDLIKHLARLAGVPLDKVRENLVNLSNEDLEQKKLLQEDDLLRVYTAVRTAGDFSQLVIDDFLKRQSAGLEKDLIHFLMGLELTGKQIIYLSLEMHTPRGSLLHEKMTKDYSPLPLPLGNIFLR